MENLTKEQIMQKQFMQEMFFIQAAQIAMFFPSLLKYITNFTCNFEDEKCQVFGSEFLKQLESFKETIGKNELVSGLKDEYYTKIFDSDLSFEDCAKQICFDLLALIRGMFLLLDDTEGKITAPVFEAVPMLKNEMKIILNPEKRKQRSGELFLFESLKTFSDHYQKFFVETMGRMAQEKADK